MRRHAGGVRPVGRRHRRDRDRRDELVGAPLLGLELELVDEVLGRAVAVVVDVELVEDVVVEREVVRARSSAPGSGRRS
jgi:hypothetical protein